MNLDFHRREILLGLGAAGLANSPARGCGIAGQPASSSYSVSPEQFGGRSNSGLDDTRAIQAAIEAVERRGGGAVVIRGRYRCGNIVVRGANVRLEGGGWLVNGRLTIAPGATNIDVADLGLVDTTGDKRTFLMDVSGRNCRFTNVRLVKDPVAGGVQMYLRKQASGCQFTGLRLKGSNGIIMMGSDHLFEDFVLESTLTKGVGGDDAFAIDALDSTSENITIRNGTVRGFSAIVSFGSAIGTTKDGTAAGIVRNVIVENVTADRCGGVAFIKPGALVYDWRNGIVEHVILRNLKLSDPSGDQFRSGIRMLAARGAIIRDVQASGIEIVARAKDRHVAPTAAVDLTLLDIGAPATIEDVSLQVSFVDPYAGAPHDAGAAGFPVDQIVRIEKRNPQSGRMSGIVLDIEGRGASFGGIYVGAGLDDAVTVRRAVLKRVATDPPSRLGGGGIWSNSRLNLGSIDVDSVKLPKFGGRALSNRRN